MVIAHSDKPWAIRRKIEDMSAGFDSHSEHPKASIDDLKHLADKDMYAKKARYYIENGIERRQ